jgi:hypothetical protein
METSLRLMLYLAIAITFAWLTWRSIWATAPGHDVVARADRRAHPVLYGLHGLFYGGMASFELSLNFGL